MLRFPRLRWLKRPEAWMINGWPPAASHAVCIFIGLGIANAGGGLPKKKINLPQSSLIMTSEKFIAKDISAPAENLLLTILDSQSSKPCTIASQTVTLIANSPQPAIAISLRATDKIWELQKKYSGITLLRQDLNHPLAPCSSEDRLSYGP